MSRVGRHTRKELKRQALVLEVGKPAVGVMMEWGRGARRKQLYMSQPSLCVFRSAHAWINKALHGSVHHAHIPPHMSLRPERHDFELNGMPVAFVAFLEQAMAGEQKAAETSRIDDRGTCLISQFSKGSSCEKNVPAV